MTASGAGKSRLPAAKITDHKRAMDRNAVPPPWAAAHAEACAAGLRQYRDPETGYRVFTEIGLRARGACCGCGCRHCPWAHEAVPSELRAVRIARPAWLSGPVEAGLEPHRRPDQKPEPPLTVVFWSGGKDSFLAARAVFREDPSATVALLTTFGQKTRVVAHQELPIQTIIRQAEVLACPLVGVPLYPGADYTTAIDDALKFVAQHAPIKALVFGDLHLDHIRQWREAQLAPIAEALGAQLHFPLWGVDYTALSAELEASGARARVCASPDFSKIAPVARGDLFGRALMDRLPANVDRFGELGEFHTELMTDGLDPTSLREW